MLKFMLLSIFFLVLYYLPSAIVATVRINFTDKANITSDHGMQEDEVMLQRLRREPAIWGEPAPDYGTVHLDGYIRFLKALLFVDSKITQHYAHNMDNVKQEILKLVREANDYFYQISVRIIVVGVMQTYRSDLSLYSFEEYRNRRISKLPAHDFAALVSYRYAGGLAYVGGMCTSKAVMLCGFYPHNPSAMGGIFFHEVAHLIGVPHHNATDFIDVSNCHCPRMRSNTPAGCLKIPGYDHDCTLQQMVNMLERNRCLKHIKGTPSFFAPFTYENSLALCGNGVLEGTEECDCGLHKLCYNWNCRADECQQIVKTWQLYIICWTAVGLSIITLIWYIFRRCSFCCASSENSLSCTCSRKTYSCGFCSLISSYFKSVVWLEDKHCRHVAISNHRKTLYRSGGNITANHLIGMPYKEHFMSGMPTVLIAPNDKECLVRKSTILRPTQPPPPPPVLSYRRTINQRAEQNCTKADISPLKLPPSLPVKPPNLSLKDIIAGSDDVYELPNTTKKRLSLFSSSIVRSNTVDNSQCSEHYTDQYDSISRKFDDDFDDYFDDDEPIIDSSSSEWQQQQQQHLEQPIRQMSPINAIEHVTQNEGKRTKQSVKSVPLHHLEHVIKLAAREESFSSSESRSQLCQSDDTVSTGLSEEEERSYASVTKIVRKFNEQKS